MAERTGPAAMVLAPVGSRRVEETLRRMMAVFGVLFTLHAVPALVEGWPSAGSPLALATAVGVIGSVLAGAFAVLLHQWVRGVFVTAGVVYLAALALWPSTVTVAAWPTVQVPWLLVMAGVPCGFMIIATRGVLPVGYLLLAGGLVAGVRSSRTGGGHTLLQSLVDGAAVVVLGLAVLLVITAIRRAARQVDVAQGAALGRYAAAQIDEATESERVRTDALVHDSVLTTFLSAAAASTPEGQAS